MTATCLPITICPRTLQRSSFGEAGVVKCPVCRHQPPHARFTLRCSRATNSGCNTECSQQTLPLLGSNQWGNHMGSEVAVFLSPSKMLAVTAFIWDCGWGGESCAWGRGVVLGPWSRKPSQQVRISKVQGKARTNLKHHSGKGARPLPAFQQLLTHTHATAGWPKATSEALSELPPAQTAKAPSWGEGRRL